MREGSTYCIILYQDSTPRNLKEQKMLSQLSSFRKPIISAFTFVLLCLVLSTFTAIAVSRSMDATIQISGKITLVGLDAYGGDINSANGAFSIALGTIYPGSSKSVSFYLRSVSNVPTTLTFSVGNWQPESLEPFMLISWDYSGNQIAPNQEIPIKIYINTVTSADFFTYLSANQVTSFSFSLTIYAQES